MKANGRSSSRAASLALPPANISHYPNMRLDFVNAKIISSNSQFILFLIFWISRDKFPVPSVLWNFTIWFYKKLETLRCSATIAAFKMVIVLAWLLEFNRLAYISLPLPLLNFYYSTQQLPPSFPSAAIWVISTLLPFIIRFCINWNNGRDEVNFSTPSEHPTFL